MARRKTIQQIHDQRRRIQREMVRRAGGGWNMTDAQVERYNKMQDISDRYVRNIRSSKAYQSDVRRSIKAERAGDYNKEQAILNRAEGRSYSQRTYMGLAKG
jgi:hypothetical protein